MLVSHVLIRVPPAVVGLVGYTDFVKRVGLDPALPNERLNLAHTPETPAGRGRSDRPNPHPSPEQAPCRRIRDETSPQSVNLAVLGGSHLPCGVQIGEVPAGHAARNDPGVAGRPRRLDEDIPGCRRQRDLPRSGFRVAQAELVMFEVDILHRSVRISLRRHPVSQSNIARVSCAGRSPSSQHRFGSKDGDGGSGRAADGLAGRRDLTRRGAVRLHLRLRRQLAPRCDRRGSSRRRPGQGVSSLRGRGQALSAGGRRRPGRVHGLPGGGPRSGAPATSGHGSLVRRAVPPDRLGRGACAFLHGEHGAPPARPAGQSQERIAATETMTVASWMAGRIDAAFSGENRQATPKALRNGHEFKKSAFAMMTDCENTGNRTKKAVIFQRDTDFSRKYAPSTAERLCTSAAAQQCTVDLECSLSP